MNLGKRYGRVCISTSTWMFLLLLFCCWWWCCCCLFDLKKTFNNEWNPLDRFKSLGSQKTLWCLFQTGCCGFGCCLSEVNISASILVRSPSLSFSKSELELLIRARMENFDFSFGSSLEFALSWRWTMTICPPYKLVWNLLWVSNYNLCTKMR